jgi:predicted esterase
VSADFPALVTLRTSVLVARAEPLRPLVIALHGRGMTERALERWLRPGIDRGGLSWWVPRGPLPQEIEHRRITYAWYVFNGDQAALKESMDEARPYLHELVAIARRTLRPSSVTLFGFSQGAYLASYVALSRPDLFDRLACCGGRPKAEFIRDLAAARGVRVLIQTGERDVAVPRDLVAQGVAPLRAAGLDVTEKSYDAEHRVTPEMAKDLAEFAS